MSGKWEALSPDVDAILGSGERRQQERHLSAAQKRERARQAARVRVTVDLPEWLKDELMRIADHERTTASGVAAYLIARGIRAIRKGTLSLPKTGSDSPRFDFVVEVTEDDAGL